VRRSACLSRELSYGDPEFAPLIRSIEAEDSTPVAAAVYARGHLRSIARAIAPTRSAGREFARDISRKSRCTCQSPPAVRTRSLPPERPAAAELTAAMAPPLVVICLLAAYGLTTVADPSDRA